MPDSKDIVAKALLREIPLAQLSRTLKTLNPANVGDNANGHGCGLGCSGPGAIDRFGHSALTATQLKTVLKDKAGLQKAIAKNMTDIGGF